MTGASAVEDSDPEGWTNYAVGHGNAEEAASVAVEQVVDWSSQALRHRYLNRIAPNHIAASTADVLVNQLQMCFVPADQPDSGESFGKLDPEPDALPVDSWARMHLRSRQRPQEEPSDGLHTQLETRRVLGSFHGAPRPQSRSASRRGSVVAERRRSVTLLERRCWPLEVTEHFDAEEERARTAKQRRDANLLEEKERAARQAEEEERAGLQMASLDHTKLSNDSYGNSIQVSQPQVENLPETHDYFLYKVIDQGVDSQSPSFSTTASPPQSLRRPTSAPAPQGGGPKKKVRVDPRHQPIDGGNSKPCFIRAHSMQPSLIETLNCRPGVTLHCAGKTRSGPEPAPDPEGRMTWAEYMELRGFDPEDTDASDVEGRAKKRGSDYREQRLRSSTLGRSRSSPQFPSVAAGKSKGTIRRERAVDLDLANGIAAADAAGTDDATATSGEAPACVSEAVAYTRRRQPGTEEKAPPAPSLATRAKKAEAIGNPARAPRERVPVLGTPCRHARPQPPLGATMGHGLLCGDSRRDAFFFPPHKSKTPGFRTRSSPASRSVSPASTGPISIG
mmetsp:Transcript_94942/g.268145  ORF Transcript_94942/g.268145 Transcript_94942/m.268145 type:complete len:563 (+) Transcript_94942:149-1837(+)